MNTTLQTGYLVRDAARAYSTGAAAREKLVFEVMLQAEGDAAPTPWHCEIDDAALMMTAEPRLTAGRGVVLRAELAGRPFVQRGVQQGFTRFLKVHEVEFVRADRSRPAVEEEQPAEVAP
jgi:hypothetical protein